MTSSELDLSYDLTFTCRKCGDCCRTRAVPLAPGEKERIESLDLAAASDRVASTPLFAPLPNGRTSSHAMHRLARVGNSCVFLEEDNSCLIHNLHGHDALPVACRQFPFLFAQGPDGITVSASFACLSVAEGTGTPMRHQESEVRSLLGDLLPESERGHEVWHDQLFSVPDRILLSAQIGLDWYSYQSLERAILEILEDESHTLAVRLLAAHTLVSAAVAEYGRGAKTTPPFAEWMGQMNSGNGQRWIYQESAPRQAARAGRRRVVLAPMILELEARCADGLEVGRRGGLSGWAALARGRGDFPLRSLPGRVDLESVDRVLFDQDSVELKDLLARYLRECLRRKALLRHPNLLKGVQYLLLRFALVGWYAAAFAVHRRREMVTVEELRAAVGVVERYADPDGAPLARAGERPPLAGSMGMLLDLVSAPVDLVTDHP
jgi:Fe-S-cluster containining protein